MLLRYWRLVLFVLAIIAVIYGIYWGVTRYLGGEIKTYQVLVSVYDDKNPDPVEDKRSSTKKGYVIGLYPENHEWSETERVSYLILKMKLNEKEANKITESEKKDIDIATLPEEQQRILKEQKKEERNPEDNKRIVSLRKYKIDLEEIGFSDPNSLLKGQPFSDKVFGWEIIESVR